MCVCVCICVFVPRPIPQTHLIAVFVRVAYSALIAGPYHDSIWPPTEAHCKSRKKT